MTQTYVTVFSNIFFSYQLKVSDWHCHYCYYKSFPYIFFSFLFLCFFFLYLLRLFTIVSLSTPCTVFHPHQKTKQKKSRQITSTTNVNKNWPIRIHIRIEFGPSSTGNWEQNLTRELRQNWTRLFLLRKLWMLRLLRTKLVWQGKAL